MRVLQVTHRYPPQKGGVETHVREISEGLASRGHDVTVFAADAGEGGATRECRNGVNVRRFRSLAPGGSMYIAPSIALAARRYDADIVHAHNYHAIPGLFAALNVSEERFVFTTHYHGESASPTRNTLLSFYRPIGGWTVRRAEQVIAVSRWEQARLRDDFGVNAKVIPNGLDVDRFVDASPLSQTRPYLLYVGRLEEYKGVQHAIRALPQLPEYELMVVGTGPYDDTLKSLAAEVGVSERTDFLGYVDNARLPGLYAGATVFLSLSMFEAYGMTVAEALTTGTPCVVLKRAALKNWVEIDGCVGIDTTQPSEISKAVEAATTSSVNYDPMTWSEVVDRVETIYYDQTRVDPTSD
ncbi:glycosyltransferase family 4 protein [Halobaculum sp. CBA1158]|uniref:glycosyltransferase family 4 protein n=1 Tax=Halobaculum sp. CBA1158 TaxID=2904243 RepID=UPI001F16DE71|nr:glycosyltransferase family 4 protein [Halobaculum sp. CBA1158]UIP01071.1 glycosyltransferase family 4 protein [Halobaculum sp. CBA1158]